jgi:hypothetical protein
MRQREFWRERSSGHIYAVALEDGGVVAWCGPLHMSEVEDEFLPTFRYTAERAAWLDRHREEFDLFVTTAPYG